MHAPRCASRSFSPRSSTSLIHRPRRESLSPLAPRRRIKERQPLDVELPKTTVGHILPKRWTAPTLATTSIGTTIPQKVPINLSVFIDGHKAAALVDTTTDYSVLSGRHSRRLRRVRTLWDGPQIHTAGGHVRHYTSRQVHRSHRDSSRDLPGEIHRPRGLRERCNPRDGLFMRVRCCHRPR